MIIAEDKRKRIVQSHDFEQVNCTIDAEDMRYVASLLRNNYSKPMLAVIREITANALDANLEAGVKKRAVVKLPTELNPVFSVRDFGAGLSQEDIFGLYSKYGKSTKRNSNAYIGAFGIGKFAPLSYGNNFTAVSYHGGVKSSYNVFVNEDDDTKIAKMNEEPSSEPSGLCVEVAIADEDIANFKNEAKEFFKFFPKDEKPDIQGVDDKFFPKQEIVIEGAGWFFAEPDQYEHHRSYNAGATALMGRVAYPLDSSGISYEGLEGNDAHHFRELLGSRQFYVQFNVGDLKLHHSRESVEYNKPTQKVILDRLQEIKNEIEEIAKEKLSEATDLWDAKCKYAQVMNAIPRSLQGIFENQFTWNGVKIDGYQFSRPYNLADDLIFTEYRKNNDADTTDGYKVLTRKTSSIYAQTDALICVQDAPKYGLSLRARTLFNQNTDVEVIYTAQFNNEVAEDYLYNDLQFNLISKDTLIYLSNIDKAKLKQGTKASGESRADVPLFAFDYKRNFHRNTDYWNNVGEKAKDLPTDSDQTYIYVPINNYKVCDKDGNTDNTPNLRELKTRINSVNNGNDKKDNIDVYGVRRKDSVKLDKKHWINFFDYEAQVSIDYCTRKKAGLKKQRRRLDLANNKHLCTFYRGLETLLGHNKLASLIRSRIGGNHILIRLIDDYKSMEENSSTTFDVR
jgi:hypothetical protein